MKGVLGTRAPGQPVIDVTHAVPAQDVEAGAIVLRHAAPWFPKGTVHLAVVDPGVGSARTPLAIETRDGFFVGPDNGVLTLAAPAAARRRVHALTDPRFHLTPVSATFHGRDVFAPAAAALASGTPIDELGEPATVTRELTWHEPEVTGDGITGRVVYVDGYGNLITNVPAAALDAGQTITIGTTSIGAVDRSYSDVAPGAPVAVIGSWGLLEVAVRDGSAANVLAAGRGTVVRAADE